MLALRISADLEQRLAALAERTGRTKSFYARRAIEEYIDDLEDHFLAEEVMRANNAQENISLGQLKELYGLDDRGHEGSEEAA